MITNELLTSFLKILQNLTALRKQCNWHVNFQIFHFSRCKARLDLSHSNL